MGGATRVDEGETMVATGGREEHRMGSVEVVAESNGDGQAPGGAARGTPAMNWWGGEAQWDEGESVDMVGGGEEARVGRNQAEAEAAMVDDGEQRRDEAIPESK